MKALLCEAWDGWRGLRLALCSNKPRLFSQELLRHLALADLFSVVLGPEDVARPKPAPDMLVAACRMLGYPRERLEGLPVQRIHPPEQDADPAAHG